MNPDYRDMLNALSAEGVEFLVVGAYALAVHGLPRATGDIDLWVRPTSANAARIWQALQRFGAPLRELTEADFTSDDVVYQIGVAPRRIDILTSITGVDFEDAWRSRVPTEVDGVRFSAIDAGNLLRNKRASGRPKDLADAAWLESRQ